MRILIVEDESAAAINLTALLKKTAPDIEIAAITESVEETVGWLRSQPQPDLIFMDIHLADGDSFKIFDYTDVPCPIIFTTAYDQYALDAFKVNSVDYLLKPIKESDLTKALEKLKRLTGSVTTVTRVRTAAALRQATKRDNFLVRVKDRIIPLPVDQIAYFYTLSEKVTACNFEGETFPVDGSLETIHAGLPADRFFRANRQFIVARQAVRDISVWFGSRLALNLHVETPEKIIISKSRVPEFKRWLSGIE